MSLHLLILIFLIITTLFSFWRDKKTFVHFQPLASTESRQLFFKKWIVEPFLLFGLTAVVCLYILGETAALYQMPDYLDEISSSLRFENAKDTFYNSFLKGLGSSIVPLLLLGTPIATMVITYLQHKDEEPETEPGIDIKVTPESEAPIIPKATKNQLDSLLPVKKVLLSLLPLVSCAISIKNAKYGLRRSIIQASNSIMADCRTSNGYDGDYA